MLTLAERIARRNMMMPEEKAAELLGRMSGDEKALIGTPCNVCGEPLSALTIWTCGTTCGSCQCGDKPVDRLPSMLILALVMVPILAQ